MNHNDGREAALLATLESNEQHNGMERAAHMAYSMRSFVRSPAFVLALLILAAITQEGARAQPAGSPSSATEPAPYCADLKHIANLAMTRERFSSIIGKPRQGNFRDTSLALTGWKDCAFYGTTAYTCDSRGFASEDAAVQAQKIMVRQILSCLETWTESTEQSSSTYIALHPKLGPASITLTLDKADDDSDIVRLTMFLRRP